MYHRCSILTFTWSISLSIWAFGKNCREPFSTVTNPKDLLRKIQIKQVRNHSSIDMSFLFHQSHLRLLSSSLSPLPPLPGEICRGAGSPDPAGHAALPFSLREALQGCHDSHEEVSGGARAERAAIGQVRPLNSALQHGFEHRRAKRFTLP